MYWLYSVLVRIDVTHQVRPLTQARLCADLNAAGGATTLGHTECGNEPILSVLSCTNDKVENSMLPNYNIYFEICMA